MPRIAQSTISAAKAILAARDDNSLGNMSNADLLAFHTAHAERFGDTAVKRFASREAGEQRCAALAEKIVAAAEAPKAQGRAPVTNQQLSDAMRSSWEDPDIRARRATRHAVTVNGTPYRSVSDAFRQLGLDFKKHAAFRAKVVAEGKQTFQGYEFKLA